MLAAFILINPARVMNFVRGLIPLHYEVSTWATVKGVKYTPRTDQYTLAMGLKPAK